MKSKVKVSQLLKGLIYFFGLPAVLLLLGGDIRWWQAWVYIGLSFLSVIISRIIIARKNPDLIEERAGFTEKADAKAWDRILSPLVAMYMPLAYFIVAGLDKRFHWSPPLADWVNIAALLVSIAGFALATWALVVNRFFSAVVRIQKDRGQKVVENGPYRLVRHPGYAGGVITSFMFPLITNSLWAFIPVALFFILVIIRTALEDRTLMTELDGYQQYSAKTRYRLLPGIW
jgi:protein-S-isoprenylcysteine O-methyltransferase Ste14